MNQLQKPRSIAFIGTGTEVGKSYVACALARALKAKSVSVIALKPVESGVVVPDQLRRDEPVESFALAHLECQFPRLHDGSQTDAEQLAQAAHQGARSLYELPEPVSPHLAAQKVNVQVSLALIQSWVGQMQAFRPDATYLLETAGGALSPLNGVADNLDLILLLRPEKTILVAPNRLGVLHDVAATLAAATARGVTVDHVILSDIDQGDPQDLSRSTNMLELKKIIIPRFAAISTTVARKKWQPWLIYRQSTAA